MEWKTKVCVTIYISAVKNLADEVLRSFELLLDAAIPVMELTKCVLRPLLLEQARLPVTKKIIC